MKNLYERARSGLPVEDFQVINGHGHIGFDYNYHIPCGSVEEILRVMDVLGIQISCISANLAILSDFRAGNDLVIEAVRCYPDRLIGYVTLSPWFPDQMRSEVSRCFSQPGMRAVKIHPWNYGTLADDPRFDPAYELAAEKNCPILVHTWGKSEVAALGRIAARYSNVGFIMAHTGALMPAMQDAVEIINRRDNVFADLALSLCYEGNVEWLVQCVGSKKVIFGTDVPVFDPRPNFARVAMARITDAEKQDILGLNMKRLLHL